MESSLDSIERMEGLLWTGLLVFGLIVAFGLLGLSTVRLRSWFRDSDGPADDDDAFLSAMHDSRRQGVVSREEFRSIHGEMVRRGSKPDSGSAGGVAATPAAAAEPSQLPRTERAEETSQPGEPRAPDSSDP